MGNTSKTPNYYGTGWFVFVTLVLLADVGWDLAHHELHGLLTVVPVYVFAVCTAIGVNIIRKRKKARNGEDHS